MKDDLMKRLIYRLGKKIVRILRIKEPDWYTTKYVEFFGQAANDLLAQKIEDAKNGLMVCKFGTVELNAVCCFLMNERGVSAKELFDSIVGRYDVMPESAMKPLCTNAGFFPNKLELGYQYAHLVKEDIKEIDILGSYDEEEEFLRDDLAHCTKVDLEGYYAPFLWENPWTKQLKGKRILVVHPFTESIQAQYARREKLFTNPDVLPEFKELILVKAVQSMACNGETTGFDTWFDALEYMKQEIDKHDYDIALIGCGAYGMNLAAHVKRKGKIAIHLAGWTQMLFGIYGNRWLEDQPEFKKLINEYWIRPSAQERPKGVEVVENACYW